MDFFGSLLGGGEVLGRDVDVPVAVSDLEVVLLASDIGVQGGQGVECGDVELHVVANPAQSGLLHLDEHPGVDQVLALLLGGQSDLLLVGVHVLAHEFDVSDVDLLDLAGDDGALHGGDHVHQDVHHEPTPVAGELAVGHLELDLGLELHGVLVQVHRGRVLHELHLYLVLAARTLHVLRVHLEYLLQGVVTGVSETLLGHFAKIFVGENVLFDSLLVEIGGEDGIDDLLIEFQLEEGGAGVAHESVVGDTVGLSQPGGVGVDVGLEVHGQHVVLVDSDLDGAGAHLVLVVPREGVHGLGVH